jgi:hypothetical protein
MWVGWFKFPFLSACSWSFVSHVCIKTHESNSFQFQEGLDIPRFSNLSASIDSNCFPPKGWSAKSAWQGIPVATLRFAVWAGGVASRDPVTGLRWPGDLELADGSCWEPWQLWPTVGAMWRENVMRCVVGNGINMEYVLGMGTIWVYPMPKWQFFSKSSWCRNP